MDQNLSSALYWYPQIARLGSGMVPLSRFVSFSWDDVYQLLDNSPTSNNLPLIDLHLAAKELGGYPVFLRTDLSSAKHEGPTAYRVAGRDDWMRAIYLTMEDNILKDLQPSAFMVRRWLNLDASFAAFRGHLISNEWRYFATKSEVNCRHFYWPEDAIRFWGIAEPSDWRERLNQLRGSPPSLDGWAITAAGLCADVPQWSVDFARDVKGRWWLLDMAEASVSWHPTHIPAHSTPDKIIGGAP